MSILNIILLLVILIIYIIGMNMSIGIVRIFYGKMQKIHLVLCGLWPLSLVGVVIYVTLNKRRIL